MSARQEASFETMMHLQRRIERHGLNAEEAIQRCGITDERQKQELREIGRGVTTGGGRRISLNEQVMVIKQIRHRRKEDPRRSLKTIVDEVCDERGVANKYDRQELLTYVLNE